jgi:hypothetical protein
MSGVRTVQVRRRAETGEVSHMQLKREVEREVEYFWNAKPWRERPVPAVGMSPRVLKARLGFDEAVRVAVLIDDPMRGALKRIADANGLDYRAFMKAVYKARRQRRAA